MYKTTRFISICLLAAGLSACGGDSDYQPSAGLSPQQLYAQACASCHGKTGEGKFGFLFSIAGSDLSVGEIAGKIRGGGDIMPAFTRISEEQASALGDYVKKL